MLPNGPEYLWLWFGIARAGLVEVPLNTGLRGDMLAHMLNTTAAAGARHRRAVARARRADCRAARDARADRRPRGGSGVGASTAFRTPCCSPRVQRARMPSSSPRDPSVILFTSGTTGPSKGVVLCHNANFRLASRRPVGLMGYGEDEVLFNMFPLFHVNAQYTSVLPAMLLDRGDVRAPRPLLRLALLGHLPRRGRHRHSTSWARCC